MEVCGANIFFMTYVFKSTYTSLRPSTASVRVPCIGATALVWSPPLVCGPGLTAVTPRDLDPYTYFLHYFVVLLVHYFHSFTSSPPQIKNKMKPRALPQLLLQRFSFVLTLPWGVQGSAAGEKIVDCVCDGSRVGALHR